MSLLEDSVVSTVENKTVKRVTDLLEKESGDEPGDNGESRGDCTRKEVRVFFKELAVTEQVGEPFCRTRKCTSNDGPIPNRSTKG